MECICRRQMALSVTRNQSGAPLPVGVCRAMAPRDHRNQRAAAFGGATASNWFLRQRPTGRHPRNSKAGRGFRCTRRQTGVRLQRPVRTAWPRRVARRAGHGRCSGVCIRSGSRTRFYGEDLILYIINMVSRVNTCFRMSRRQPVASTVAGLLITFQTKARLVAALTNAADLHNRTLGAKLVLASDFVERRFE